ncbi:MAG: CNNM domain-containing protein [Christensenellaceae bacterium]
MIGAVILQIVLIFLNAIFASAEIAVISTNETKLQKIRKKGSTGGVL